jgi:predicted secreted protein
MILKTLPLGVRMVVDEESLSVVTSAPELPHNKTRGFKRMIPE